MTRPVRIGVTMGDPAGIGPEILLDAFSALAPRVTANELHLVAIGVASVLERVAKGKSLTIRLADERVVTAFPHVPLATAAEEQSEIPVGRVSREGGRLAYAAVERAVKLSLSGAIDGFATGPISKEAINLAGYAYAGHTDMLASLTQTKGSVMMLAHGDLRVTHITTHVALSKVPSLITPERIRHVLDLTIATLESLGISRPRIAVAALNPHAGENGLFGDEDDRVLVPAVAAYAAAGHAVTGPHSGDTVFVRAAAGEFDAVIAMYHDQGHIPVKLLGFRIDRASRRWVGLSGVNVTLGLPIIRTSVDHGTAFDIAGKGIANPQSMIEAIEYAERLARGRARNADQKD
jgi:4-hydroxythreonine-4-phosphate dehydrogenase